MKIRINDIPDEGLTLSEPFDPMVLELDTPDLQFTEPLQVTAMFQKQQDTVLVAVAVNGRAEEICGRCLEHRTQPYGQEFHLDYSVEARMDLDVTDDIRQEILLSVPVKFLCREDCRGLCTRCGTNLNERSCEHASSEA